MRIEYGRADHFKKNSYLELDEQHHGTYNLPEIYVTDLSPARLKKRLGRVHFRCLQLMAKQTHWRERMKKMKTNDFTLFHMQIKIREEINAILMTDFSVHKRSFHGNKKLHEWTITPIKHYLFAFKVFISSVISATVSGTWFPFALSVKISALESFQ